MPDGATGQTSTNVVSDSSGDNSGADTVIHRFLLRLSEAGTWRHAAFSQASHEAMGWLRSTWPALSERARPGRDFRKIHTRGKRAKGVIKPTEFFGQPSRVRSSPLQIRVSGFGQLPCPLGCLATAEGRSEQRCSPRPRRSGWEGDGGEKYSMEDGGSGEDGSWGAERCGEEARLQGRGSEENEDFGHGLVAKCGAERDEGHDIKGGIEDGTRAGPGSLAACGVGQRGGRG